MGQLFVTSQKIVYIVKHLSITLNFRPETINDTLIKLCVLANKICNWFQAIENLYKNKQTTLKLNCYKTELL